MCDETLCVPPFGLAKKTRGSLIFHIFETTSRSEEKKDMPYLLYSTLYGKDLRVVVTSRNLAVGLPFDEKITAQNQGSV